MKNSKTRLEIIKILERKPNFIIRWGMGIFTSIAIVMAIFLLAGIEF